MEFIHGIKITDAEALKREGYNLKDVRKTILIIYLLKFIHIFFKGGISISRFI